MKYLRQPQLPRRIPLQHHPAPKKDQQIRLRTHIVAQLRTNQPLIYLLRPDIPFLRHGCQRDGEVDEGVAAVVLREEEYGEVLGGGGAGGGGGRGGGRGVGDCVGGFDG